MRIVMRNNARLPNKYVRFVKWKCYDLGRKYDHLLYVHVYINAEGKSPTSYAVTIRLGIPGHDLFIQNKSTSLNDLFKKSFDASKRRLTKSREMTKNVLRPNIKDDNTNQ